MTQLDQLRACLQGNEEAVRLLSALKEISHTWDDLVDKDKGVEPAQLHRAFWLAIVGLRKNAIYRQFEDELLPVLEASIFNYVASCAMERDPGRPREIAHAARYAIGDVALVLARLIGGVTWAMEQAPALKLLANQDTFENFNREMEARYANSSVA